MFGYQSPPPFSPSPDQGMSAPVAPAPEFNGIPGAVGAPPAPYPPMMPPSPASMQYMAETQDDGTVLLRIKNPDGSPGPALKVIKIGGGSKSGGNGQPS